jgi:fucose 4-O-acetylase-like acetyltransferase
MMKGIGILLVVLAHAIGKNDINAIARYDNGIFNITCSFFMLMFMMVSGYLVYGKVTDKGWLSKNIIKWMPPLLIFTVIYWVVGALYPTVTQFSIFEGVSFIKYLSYVLAYGFNGLVLWYLWVLILSYFLAWLLEKGRLHIKIPLIIQFIVLVIAMQFTPISMLGVFALKWYGIFFLIGYVLHHYKLNGRLAYISLLLFPLCGYLFNWMMPYEDIQYGCFGLAAIIPDIQNGKWILLGVTLLMALLGTGFVYSIAKLIKWKYAVKVLSYLGAASIGIYLLHIMFVGIVSNYWLAALIALAISIGLYELLKRWKHTNRLLFGRLTDML